MQGPDIRLIAAGGVLLLALLLFLPVPGFFWPADGKPAASLLYASAGSLPQLLNTGQIDAFIVWEPVAANTELAGIGKRIAVPSDLPPPGKWNNTACCILLLNDEVIRKYPDISALLSALTTAAISRTNEEPDLAKEITADWVFGTDPILTPEGTLDPLDVENRSFGNTVFTADAGAPESGMVSRVMGGAYDPETMVNRKVAVRGKEFLNGSRVPRIPEDIPTLSIGYLPSSDTFAPLYVMVKNASWFCDRYGFCLVPDDPGLPRPIHCTLLVRGQPAAYISLVPGQSGGGLMTTVGQEALDGTYVGSVPAELQIALGNPSSIIESINTGGTGLVVGNDAPCSDWEGFTRWIRVRSLAGKPVTIGTVQSSIQEDMIREGLAYENISVNLYGTF